MSFFAFIRKYLLYIIALFFVISYCWTKREANNEIKLLEKEGVITKARIFNKVNRLRRSDSYKYEFYVNNIKYIGNLHTSDIYYIDDSIEVMCYSNDPNINNISPTSPSMVK